jgi:two-component system LytT family response regulator
MENLNVIILEEKGKGAGSIHQLMLDNFQLYVSVVAVESDLDHVENILRDASFDLIILDTDIVSGGNVFELLEPYMSIIDDHELIVVSSSTAFIADSFRFSAIDYILKPVGFSEMVVAIERAKANVEIRQSMVNNSYFLAREPVKIIAIPSISEVKILPVSTIVYLEAEGKYTTFHTMDNKAIVSSRNLGSYEKLLVNNNFFRIHHSYIVNVDLACNIYKKDGVYLEIINKKYLPISKRKTDSFYKFLGI